MNTEYDDIGFINDERDYTSHVRTYWLISILVYGPSGDRTNRKS